MSELKSDVGAVEQPKGGLLKTAANSIVSLLVGAGLYLLATF